MNMLIAIDIGNTTISLGVLKGKSVVKEYSFLTTGSAQKGLKAFTQALKGIERREKSISEVVICSVVPKQLKAVERLITNIFKRKAVVIGRDIHVPIKNNYTNPKQVGQDRLVGAYAAKILYGHPAIIIDLGTAITFDVINNKGAYDGGIIVPGIRLSAESLFKKTALLPEVANFKAPRNILGKNTEESILSGLFYGYGALCNGLIQSLQKKLGKKAKVIITGGHTEIMKRFIKEHVTNVDEHLVFKGIYLTYRSKDSYV